MGEKGKISRKCAADIRDGYTLKIVNWEEQNVRDMETVLWGAAQCKKKNWDPSFRVIIEYLKNLKIIKNMILMLTYVFMNVCLSLSVYK